MESIKEKFEKGRINNTFLRVDAKHNTDIFIGCEKNGREAMVIQSRGSIVKVGKIDSTKLIEAILVKEQGGKTSLSFVLKDSDDYNIFLKFCEDIIESSRSLNTDKVIEFIIKRWDEWRSIFKNIKNEILSEPQIIGLLGELVFLGEYMIPKYGEKAAIESWQGPEMLHKDFEIFDTWYEVKTKLLASVSVKISSIEQLDSDLIGNLAILSYEKTNSLNEYSIDLNMYIKYLETSLDSYDLKLMLLNKLSKIGYNYDERYTAFNYKFSSLKLFKIDEDFPRLKRESLINGIIKANYEISTEAIKKLKYEEVGINEFTRI